MRHLDDGVLNALLDGELTDAERAEADRHLAQCAACRDRLAEAREFMAEADGLVAAMETPARAPRTGTGPSTAPGGPAGGAGLRPHRMDYRALAWAATVVLALGAGYLGGARMRLANTPEAPRAVPSAEQAPVIGASSTRPKELATPSRGAAAPDTEAQLAVRASPVSPPPSAGRVQIAVTPVQEPQAGAAPNPAAELSPQPRQDTTVAAKRDRADEAASYIDAVPANPGYRGNAFAASKAGEAGALAASRRLTIRDVQGFRRIGWDTAIAVLGGSIRLIDGQTPVALDLAPAGEAAGLETGRPVVRIRYLAGGRDTVDLLEQRLSAMRQERKTIGDSAMVFHRATLPGGGSEIRWETPGGFLLVLRSALTADQLLELAHQIR